MKSTESGFWNSTWILLFVYPFTWVEVLSHNHLLFCYFSASSRRLRFSVVIISKQTFGTVATDSYATQCWAWKGFPLLGGGGGETLSCCDLFENYIYLTHYLSYIWLGSLFEPATTPLVVMLLGWMVFHIGPTYNPFLCPPAPSPLTVNH